VFFMKNLTLSPRLIPWLFVLIWSTGFVAAKYGLPYAEPFTLLSYRNGLTLIVLFIIMQVKKSIWPSSGWAFIHLMVTGLLIHGVYLGGVFQAIKWEIPIGLTAMIIGLQPLVMAFIAVIILHERIIRKQWIGLIIGLLGLYLVLFEKFDLAIEGFFTGFSFLAVLAVFGSLVGISLGTIYQKRFCSDMDLISGTLIQYLGAFILCIIMSLCFETGDILWTNAFMITLAWQVFGLSIGAVLLLMTMIKQDALARVGSYFYLVPVLVAIQAWYLFDETMNFISIIGVLLIVFAVAIASSKK
jgi:drug/metabolite transporter (DMT)-like permease